MPKPVCTKCNSVESFLWRLIDDREICNDCFTGEAVPEASAVVPEESVVSEPILPPASIEILPKSTEMPPESTEMPPESTEMPPKSTEMPPASAEMLPASIEMLPASIEMLPASIELHPASTEMPPPPVPLRKSLRSTRYQFKDQPSGRSSSNRVGRRFGGRPPIPKGQGRRSMFKKRPTKSPNTPATIRTSDSVYFKSTYMQVGDVVSMLDVEGGVYYAQIRSFVTDEYQEKSAVVTWLLPTKSSPPPEECFSPATYIMGPEEDLPRKLDCMEFIMHAPVDYFKDSTTPYPPLGPNFEDNAYRSGFIWASMDEKYRQ